jgi:hypothetical protein
MPSEKGSGLYILAYNNHAIAIDWDLNFIFDCAFHKVIHYIDTSILKLLFGKEYIPQDANLRRIIIPNRELLIQNTNVDYRKKQYRQITHNNN